MSAYSDWKICHDEVKVLNLDTSEQCYKSSFFVITDEGVNKL